ncbi:hypothetical protein PMAYCL1PPCAC_05768, partial [Pristionchus mayeri]
HFLVILCVFPDPLSQSAMEDGGYNFRRTQSCRAPKSATSVLRKSSRQSSRSRSSRRTGSSLASLSFSQRQAIQVSWRLIRPQANSTFRKIFLELEIACPKVKQIFYKAALVDAFNKDGENAATLDEHVKLAAKFFDDLLAVFDNEEEFRTLIRRMGAVHAVLARSCNFSGEIWERLGEIAMERICGLESCQKTREASRAWRTLIACVIDELRTGFEDEHRLVTRRSSSSSDLPDELLLEEEGAAAINGDEIPRCPYSNGSANTDDLQTKLRELRLQYTSTVPLQ